MEHPKAKGDRSTMAIILALHEAGLAVYLPFGENTAPISYSRTVTGSNGCSADGPAPQRRGGLRRLQLIRAPP